MNVLKRRISHLSVAVFAAAALCASALTGCGSDTKAPESTEASPTSAAPETSPTSVAQVDQLMADSSEVMKTLRAVHVNLVVTNLQLQMETVDADVTNEPKGQGRAVGSATIRMAPDADPVPMDFVIQNKTTYTKGPDGRYTARAPEDKIYRPGVVLSPDKGLGNIIANVKNPKTGEPETIAGVRTVRVTGTVDAAVVNAVIPGLGDSGELPVTLWIAEGTPANLVKMDVTKDPGNVVVTLSKWGEPVTIPNTEG